MAGRKTFTSATLTSADVNGYLMNQVNIQCTSSTRPSSPHDGMCIEETDTDRTYKHDGTNWVLTGARSSSGRCGMKVTVQQPGAPLASNTFINTEWGTSGAIDTHSGISQYTPTGRYVIPVAGLWHLSFYMSFTAAWASTSESFMRFTISGAESHDFVISSVSAQAAGGTTMALAASATVDLGILQNSGSTKNWNPGWVQMWRVSP